MFTDDQVHQRGCHRLEHQAKSPHVQGSDVRAEPFRDHLGSEAWRGGSLDEELVLGNALTVDDRHRDGGGLGADACELEAGTVGHEQAGELLSVEVIRKPAQECCRYP